MTRAEERAMEAYPPRMAYNSMVSVALKEKRDINANNRQKFIQGYVTAEQDLMDKAKQWFTDNIPSEKLQLLWCEFEQFITE